MPQPRKTHARRLFESQHESPRFEGMVPLPDVASRKQNRMTSVRRPIATGPTPRALSPKDRQYLRSLREAEMSLWLAIQGSDTKTANVEMVNKVSGPTNVAPFNQKRRFAFGRVVSRIFREMRSAVALKRVLPAFSTPDEKRDAMLFAVLAAATLLTFIGFVAIVVLP